jgi:tetratricopeptide (TPR) repeat protein
MAFRRKRGRRMRRHLVIALMALAAIGMVVAGGRALLPERRDTAAADRATARALALHRLGDPTGARNAAQEAAAADTGSARAQVVLALMQLQLGDGAGAEASLDRATAIGGFDMARTRQLRGHALLLQGEAERALAELDAADRRYLAYADRVRAEARMALGDYPGAQALLEAAVAERPGDARAWVALSRYRDRAGDLAGAIVASANAVALNPRLHDALAQRAAMVRAQYGLVAALPWYERALERDGANHDTLIAYAATLGDVGRPRAMLAAVRRAAEARRGSPDALYLQAVLAARGGRFDLARAIWQRTGGAIDGTPGGLLLGGLLDLQGGNYSRAVAQLGELVAEQPMNLTARRLLATAYMRADASRNAIDVLAPMVARGDADALSLMLAARAHERIGEHGVAAGLIDRAALPIRAPGGGFDEGSDLAALHTEAARRPGEPAAMVALLRGLIERGDKGAAMAQARALASRYPGVPQAHVVHGDVLMQATRASEAAAAYRRAAAVRFDEPVMLRLVEASEAAGDGAGAQRALALFLSQNPANVAALRMTANWQLAAGEADAAVDTLERLRARLGDRDAALLSELATAYGAVGEAEVALRYAAAAYAIAPQNVAVADGYGRALAAAGNRAGARQLWRRALAIAPGHRRIARDLAAVAGEGGA